jgi:hypothetical protein
VWGWGATKKKSSFPPLNKMKLLSNAKEIQHVKNKIKIGNALPDLLIKTSHPIMLSIKVIKKPFNHSYPHGL